MKNKATMLWSFKILLAVFFVLVMLPYNTWAEKLLLSENLDKIHILPHGLGIPIGKVFLVKNGGTHKEGLVVLFSPTSNLEFNAVDLTKNHTWYGYDEARKRHYIEPKLYKK